MSFLTNPLPVCQLGAGQEQHPSTQQRLLHARVSFVVLSGDQVQDRVGGHLHLLYQSSLCKVKTDPGGDGQVMCLGRRPPATGH